MWFAALRARLPCHVSSHARMCAALYCESQHMTRSPLREGKNMNGVDTQRAALHTHYPVYTVAFLQRHSLCLLCVLLWPALLSAHSPPVACLPHVAHLLVLRETHTALRFARLQLDKKDGPNISNWVIGLFVFILCGSGTSLRSTPVRCRLCPLHCIMRTRSSHRYRIVCSTLSLSVTRFAS